MVEGQPRVAGKFVKRDGGAPDGITDGSFDTGSGSAGESGGSFETVDPTAITPGTGDGNADSQPGDGKPAKRGRGRPKSQRIPEVKAATLDNRQATLSVEALNDLLFSIHFGIAAIVHQPEFALDQEESRKLAISSANVLRHYNVRTTAKAMDWVQLAITLGMVYTPRIILLTASRRKPDAAPKEAPSPFNPMNDLAGLSPSMVS